MLAVQRGILSSLTQNWCVCIVKVLLMRKCELMEKFLIIAHSIMLNFYGMGKIISWKIALLLAKRDIELEVGQHNWPLKWLKNFGEQKWIYLKLQWLKPPRQKCTHRHMGWLLY